MATMTEQEYRALSPRQKDVLIAETVFGLRRVTGAEVPEKHYQVDLQNQEAWVDDAGEQVYCTHCGNMPTYLEDIAAAWQVVVRMQALGFITEAEIDAGSGFTIGFRRPLSDACRFVTVTDIGLAPGAICEAALKAKGVVEG